MLGILPKRSSKSPSWISNFFRSCFMVSGRPFIYKKKYKIYFLFGIIVHASACSIPIREYEFPEQSFLEQRRMCQQVSSRNSKQYMVVDREVLPMKKDEIMAPIQNTESDLQQGVYYCGIFQARNYSCSPYQTRRLDGKECRFQR